jgi:spermidine synthase
MKSISFLIKRDKIIEVIFLITAITTGFNLQLNWFSLLWDSSKYITIRDFARSDSWAIHGMIWRPVLGCIITPAIIYGLRYLFRVVLSNFEVFKKNIDEYSRYDAIAYLPLLLTCTGYFGLKVDFFLIFLLFFIIQSYLIFMIYAEHNQVDMNTDQIKNNRLFVLFFVSGFAALIYQVVWQRALFRFFGVNIESITIVVSVFMLGLGLGALIGGFLSEKFPNRLPNLFVLCEVTIGLFGFFSLKLFSVLTLITMHSSQLTVALTIYGVLALPTICMGATLPLLVEYFHRTIRKVGKTVSFLYFINTLGSALASFFTVEVLFVYFGMQFSTIFASICNLFVALMGVLFIKHNIAGHFVSNEINNITLKPNHTYKLKMHFYFILIMACITGYIAMSQEILWIRYISFANEGRADVFAKSIGSILVGIALGSFAASMICERFKEHLMAIIAICMLVASILYFLGIPLLSYGITKMKVDNAIFLMYIYSGLIAFLMGISLPVLSQYAVYSPSGVGLSVSAIYFANIIGSTVGPILTGFFLLDWMSFEENVLFLSILTWMLGVILWLTNIKSYSFKKIYKPMLVFGSLLAFIYFSTLYENIFEKIQLKKGYNGQSFKHIIQNRSGIITVIAQPKGDDIVYGGGVYDGKFNTSLKINSNWIDRAYMFAAIKLKPLNVLEIGLSSGSWARIVANHQDVKSLDIVEINPGYLKLILKYPENRSILSDEKVRIHIDDGRRWLLRSDKKFDFILMNTTYYWRSQANNLLSKEFIEICKNHLKEGGVIYYNSTNSPDVPFTSAQVYKNVTRYGNFIAASDHPFPSDSIMKRENLNKFFAFGKPVFDPHDSVMLGILKNLVQVPLNNLRKELLNNKDRYLITDDNLASEFKTDNKPYIRNRAWHLIF